MARHDTLKGDSREGDRRADAAYRLGSADVEAIEIHHLVPRRDEVGHELLAGIGRPVDLRDGPELGVRSEDRGRSGCRSTSPSPVARSRPSKTSSDYEVGCHSVFMSSRFTKKSLVRVAARSVKTPCADPPAVRVEDAHAPDEHRHLGSAQRQQLRTIDHQFLCCLVVALAEVVAESVSGRFERHERVGVGLLRRCVGATRREGNRDVVPGILRRGLDGRASAEHDQVGQRHRFARAVELGLDALEDAENPAQFGRVVDVPVVLRSEANACTVGATALVAVAERRGRSPRGRHQLGDAESGLENLRLERGDVVGTDQLVIDRRDRVLPDQFLGRRLPVRGNEPPVPCRGGAA